MTTDVRTPLLRSSAGNRSPLCKRPFIRVATRLASSDLLNPSLLTSLFCKISENLVAATHAAPPPELVAFCAGQPPPPPMPPPLPGQTQGWQSRLGACIALFRDSHRASQISARYKAPLIFVDCLNTIAPFVVNNSDGTFAGIGDAVKDAAKAVLPTKQLNEMLFVLAGITTAFYNWDENGDNVGRFTEGIRMARLTGSVHGVHAVLAMCSPFCPQNVDDLPVWNQSGQPPGDIDGRNLVEDLEGIFGGLEYYFSPDTVITRAIMDAALAPYNDLALMMRFISTVRLRHIHPPSCLVRFSFPSPVFPLPLSSVLRLPAPGCPVGTPPSTPGSHPSLIFSCCCQKVQFIGMHSKD